MELEKELLILVSRMNMTEEQKNRFVELFDKKLNWEYILFKSLRHKVTCILYYHIIKNKLFGRIDRCVRKFLDKYYIATGYRYLKCCRELSVITNELNKQNIPYALIKGINIVDKVYSEIDFCLREFGDIDILIEKKNLSALKVLLNSIGYIQGKYNIHTEEIIPFSREDLIYWRTSSHQVGGYVKKFDDNVHDLNNICSLDVNFTIFEGGNIADKISTTELLSHLNKKFIDYEHFYYCLDYEYDLIQICYHFYKDLFYEFKKDVKTDYVLLKFCDVREFILKLKKSINWGELEAILIEKNINATVYYCLFLVNSVYGDLEIENFLDKIKPKDEVLLSEIHEKSINIHEYLFS